MKAGMETKRTHTSWLRAIRLTLLGLLLWNPLPRCTEASRLKAISCNLSSGRKEEIEVEDWMLTMLAAVHPGAEEGMQLVRADSAKQRPSSAIQPSTVRTVASDLVSPDGIALHPSSGDIYVAEEDLNRISLIWKGRRSTAVHNRTPIYSRPDVQRDALPPLRSPEGLAFSEDGDLYVVEDTPGGRLLRFTLGRHGEALYGTEIEIPGCWSKFAWEGVAVGSGGQILIAGSDVEANLSGESGSPFVSGVILCRDLEGSWWQLYRQPFASFSSVAFSRDEKKAAYTCELQGTIGWLSLSGPNARRGESCVRAKSPESIDILPDGRLLVSEEAGNVLLLNPKTDACTTWKTALGPIESVCWDRRQSRVLVTRDASGDILSFGLPSPATDTACLLDEAPFSAPETEKVVPARCPSFLAEVLACGGADFREPNGSPVSFRTFADRVPMMAVDAVVEPSITDRACSDPITNLQCVIFNPNQISVTEAGPALPLSVLIAGRASGKTVLTKSSSKSTAGFDLATGDSTSFGSLGMQIPFPGAVNVSAEGVGSMHFMGMGEEPDFHIVLNTREPAESYVAVDYGDEGIVQHPLVGADQRSLLDCLVISYSRPTQEQWVWLGDSPEEAPSTLPGTVLAKTIATTM